MNKKILLIVIAATSILLGVGGYFYFKKTTVSPTQISNFFPEGSRPLLVVTPSTGGEEGGNVNVPFVPSSGAAPPRLYELHKTPVAGASFIETGKGVGRTIAARYIERGLGHIYETPLATLAESRISNETHSRLSEAVWGNAGKSVIVRSVDNKDENVIKTSILNLNTTITSFARGTSTAPINDSVQIEEIFLPDNIPFLAAVEDGSDKIFYLENDEQSSAGSATNYKGSRTSIFNSTFTEWLPQFPNQKLVTLTTKPSANVPGHLFFLDTKTKTVTKVLGGINGLTTQTSHDGKSVLYAETKNGAPDLYVYNIAKKESRALSIQTLPEKCAWSAKDSAVAYCAVPQSTPFAPYPDQWYQGLLSFSDSIWKINTITAVAEKIQDLPALDVINPVVSSGDDYFLFLNKITGTPWVLRTSEANTAVAAIKHADTVVPEKIVLPASNLTQGMVKVK